ncbi:MAG: hypothetical protein H6604_07315 [Flavobacteriales bacterium]|nr:hypothetical protein [Flavobacteriales bacterium]
MKNIIVLISVFFLFSACIIEEDIDCYHCSDISVTSLDLIKIHTKDEYKVNDVLYIESSFSKLQDEKGYSNKLDIYKTTNSDSFTFSFSLQKMVFGSWTDITLLGSDFEEEGLGGIYAGYYIGATCVLNEEKTQYKFKKGIILREAGEYRLVINPILYSDVYYNSENYLALKINTSVAEIPSSSYEFTVNE